MTQSRGVKPNHALTAESRWTVTVMVTVAVVMTVTVRQKAAFRSGQGRGRVGQLQPTLDLPFSQSASRQCGPSAGLSSSRVFALAPSGSSE